MDFSSIKAISIPEGVVTKIMSAGVVLWQTVTEAFKNWVKYSTESDGKTIYNGGLGYKGGYRLSSSGAEKESDYCTTFGYIPAKGGDTIRFCGQENNGDYANWCSTSASTNYICAYGSSRNFLYAGNSRNGYDSSSFIESMTQDGSISIIKLKEVSAIAYIRMSVYAPYSPAGINGETAIITVNQEIV